MKKKLIGIFTLCVMLLICACGLVACNGVGTHKHKYTSTVTEATCTTKGYTTYTCSCGDNYYADYTRATGHELNNVMYANATEHWKAIAKIVRFSLKNI